MKSQLKELLEARAAKLDQLRASVTDGTKFAEIEADLETLNTNIEATEKREARVREFEQGGADLESRANQPATPPIREGRSPLVVVAGEDRAKFRSIGHQLQEIHFRAVHRAMLPGGVYEARAATGYNEGADGDGGLLLEPEFENDLMPKVLSESALMARCDVRPTTKARLVTNQIKSYDKSSSFTGAAIAYWVSESGAITASKASLERKEWQPRKLGALYYATDELLEDEVALSGEINAAIPVELAMTVDEAIVNGSGTDQPQGVLRSAALVSVAKEDGQAADTVVAENLVKMWARLYGRSRANAVWLYNQALDAQLPLLSLAAGTAGQLAFMPAGGLSGSPFATLFGRPMIPCEHCAAPGDLGDILLTDLKMYKVALRRGVKAASSIHVKFVEEETAFRFSMRVDGSTKLSTVITPRHGSTFTVSPFVALAAR